MLPDSDAGTVTISIGIVVSCAGVGKLAGHSAHRKHDGIVILGNYIAGSHTADTGTVGGALSGSPRIAFDPTPVDHHRSTNNGSVVVVVHRNGDDGLPSQTATVL